MIRIIWWSYLAYVKERINIRWWHHYRLFPIFHLVFLYTINLALYLGLIALLFTQCHHKKFILSFTGLDLIFHELFLCDHSLHLSRHLVNRIEIILFHLNQSLYLISEPIQIFLQFQDSLIVCQSEFLSRPP
jgi:hypothetical protein